MLEFADVCCALLFVVFVFVVVFVVVLLLCGVGCCCCNCSSLVGGWCWLLSLVDVGFGWQCVTCY